MKKLKIMTMMGTRPEIIKLSRVLAALDTYTDHVTVHTGQNYDYELNQIFFDQLGIRKPDHFLEAAGKNGTETVAAVISKLDALLDETGDPDAFLILGDTNSCMCAYVAKRRQIPLFHMEAGNRCFDERVPEEINRRMLDHISDINLVYSEQARDNLLREGLDPARVIKTGSPMAEIFKHHKKDIEGSDVLSRLELTEKGFFLASLHREDNVDTAERLKTLVGALEMLAKAHKKPVVFSTHPRTQKRIEAFLPGRTGGEYIRFMKPLGFFDYVHLQRSAHCVLSDSGTLTEEASLLGFPAVMLREAHERPEGMDEGAVVMTGLNAERLLQAVEVVTTSGPMRDVPDYTADNVSVKMVRLIHSYTDYVNRVVWQKKG